MYYVTPCCNRKPLLSLYMNRKCHRCNRIAETLLADWVSIKQSDIKHFQACWRMTILTVGCICRLMAVSWTGWALAWLREEWRACGLMVEWKMVACWLGVEGWCVAGLDSTETGCCDGWMEAVCSSWPAALWEPGLWWTTNCCCCLCCWTRECGWIWVYARKREKKKFNRSIILSVLYIIMSWGSAGAHLSYHRAF